MFISELRPATIAKRIISLVPSQTELLSYLNLEKETIGITKFCIHPANWYRKKQRIGGTKNINIELIRTLQPDLIIANKEENVKEQVELLARSFPVWCTDVNNLAEAISMITDIGGLTGKAMEATELIKKIEYSFQQLPEEPQKTAAYLIWKDPYMVAGGNNFISDMMNYAGFNNVFSKLPRYPEVSVQQLVNANPDYIFLSSEPYPFKEKHITELTEAFHATMSQNLPKIICVDGEMFSWYGSRLLFASDYFKKLKGE